MIFSLDSHSPDNVCHPEFQYLGRVPHVIITQTFSILMIAVGEIDFYTEHHFN